MSAILRTAMRIAVGLLFIAVFTSGCDEEDWCFDDNCSQCHDCWYDYNYDDYNRETQDNYYCDEQGVCHESCSRDSQCYYGSSCIQGYCFEDDYCDSSTCGVPPITDPEACPVYCNEQDDSECYNICSIEWDEFSCMLSCDNLGHCFFYCNNDSNSDLPECDADNPCEIGFSCIDGSCKEDCDNTSCTAYYCDDDVVCGIEKVCLENRCHFKCNTNDECPISHICSQDNVCIENLQPTKECTFNYECQAGVCINATCHPTCSDDTSCEFGEVCIQGICKPDYSPNVECYFSSDCSGACEECVNGSCLLPCTDDDECDSDHHCIAGYCQAI